MTRKCKLAALTLIFFSIFLGCLNSAESEWVLGAGKFTFTRNQTDPLSEGLAVMFPSRILEKLSENQYRSIQENESAERELYKLRQERNSLYLQFTSQIKKRDSLVLGKYSQSELKRRIEEENKKIDELKSKLSENSLRQKELLTTIEEFRKGNATELQNASANSSFIANLFSNDKKSLDEKVVLYRKDISALFNPSQKAIDQGFNSPQYEKEVVSAKINCLITGTITAYDEYVAVTVESYVYPGCRLINSVTEFGSIDDADLIASNVARQLAPAITNSMPVEIKIEVLTPLPKNTLNIYIDDVLYKDSQQTFTIDSGVHFIQFTAQGYKNAGTNYYFEGNKAYEIKVELEKLESNIIFLLPKSVLQGDFLINGKSALPLADGVSKITINGNAVLGEFISRDKEASFFYIPQNKLESGALYKVNVKPMDSSDYIEKRRKGMYLSYSILVTSLIPTIITNGKYDEYSKLLSNNNYVSSLIAGNNYNKVAREYDIWNISSKAFSGISIACGIWFIFELYRYFSAANSVLPLTSKITFDYQEAAPLVEAAAHVEEATVPVEGAEAVAPQETENPVE